MIKCISNGRKISKYPELAGYEYEYFGIAWTPVENNRMAYVLIGTNNKDAGNSNPLYDAELISYTGSLYDPTFAGTTYFFKNGYLHADNGPAYIDEKGIGPIAKNGLFDGPSGEAGAWKMLEVFSAREPK